MKLKKFILTSLIIFISIFTFNFLLTNIKVNASTKSNIIKSEIERFLNNRNWSTKLHYVKKASYHKMNPSVYYTNYNFSSLLPITTDSIVTKFYDSNKNSDNQENYSGDPGFKKITYKKIGHKFYKIRVGSSYGKPYVTYIKVKNKNTISVKFQGYKYLKGYHTFYAN